ncbi:MAG: exopolysaccharide biosynthesis protein [Verrucomicrobia bacterium]|nr:exopolysaccharide biosynthesis protein [Verrucomicrobiota bacterium]
MRQLEHHTLEQSFTLLLQTCAQKPFLLFKEILGILAGKSYFLLFIILSLPFCQPLQIPGISTPFGIAIMFIGFATMLKKNIWLPKKILLKQISSPHVEKIVKSCLSLMKKIRVVLRLRMVWLCKNKVLQPINGLLFIILGFLLALPLPIPLTNLTSGWSIFLIALGLLEDDGIFVLGGYLIALLTFSFFVVIAFSVERII